MCGPNFCSRKITQDVRDYAANMGVDEMDAIQIGMDETAKAFIESGGEVYR